MWEKRALNDRLSDLIWRVCRNNLTCVLNTSHTSTKSVTVARNLQWLRLNYCCDKLPVKSPLCFEWRRNRLDIELDQHLTEFQNVGIVWDCFWHRSGVVVERRIKCDCNSRQFTDQWCLYRGQGEKFKLISTWQVYIEVGERIGLDFCRCLFISIAVVMDRSFLERGQDCVCHKISISNRSTCDSGQVWFWSILRRAATSARSVNITTTDSQYDTSCQVR